MVVMTGGAPGIKWAGARAAAQHPTVHWMDPPQRMIRPQVRRLGDPDLDSHNNKNHKLTLFITHSVSTSLAMGSPTEFSEPP